MKLLRKVGTTSEIWQIFIADSSSSVGAGLPGLLFNTASLVAYYHRDTDTTATAISLVTMTVGTFTSSGFKEIDATNMPGWYQFCPPNAALASGARSCAFHLKGASNMAPLPIEVDLDAQVDVTTWNGTAVAAPATAGIPEVNVKNINNVSASSVTAVNANIGVTQPINFNGTGGSAMVKSDVEQWAASAVQAPNVAGTPIVDLKYTLGTPSAGAAGSVRADAVSGAVGSVTGNVGGNVTGSVASVLAGGLIDLTTTTYGEPAGPVGATATLKDMIIWIKTLGRNKITQNSSTQTLFKDDGSTPVSTSADSDDGTTFTRGKWS